MRKEKREKLLRERKPIVPDCEGCDKVETLFARKLCSTYINPSIWWRANHLYSGRCPVATHLVKEKKKDPRGIIGDPRKARRKK